MTWTNDNPSTRMLHGYTLKVYGIRRPYLGEVWSDTERVGQVFGRSDNETKDMCEAIACVRFQKDLEDAA